MEQHSDDLQPLLPLDERFRLAQQYEVDLAPIPPQKSLTPDAPTGLSKGRTK